MSGDLGFVEEGSHPMLDQIMSYQKVGKVMIINIIGPVDSREKMSWLSNELAEFCAEIAWDGEIQVIILTGAGEKSFFIETDLIGAVSRINGEEPIKFWSITEPIAKLNKPVIAAINGDAIGYGLELALACDIRITTDTSCFGLPQIKIGYIPRNGGTQRLSRLVGKGNALEMILTGETINAQEAYRIGLVNKIVPSDQVIKVAMDMAREMASKGPIALKYAKEAICKGMDLTLEQGLRLESDLYLLIHTTKDRTEGIQAFREKRTPKFEGR